MARERSARSRSSRGSRWCRDISTLSFRDVEFDVELPHEISEMVTARNP
jgi:hypothetical protein